MRERPGVHVTICGYTHTADRLSLLPETDPDNVLPPHNDEIAKNADWVRFDVDRANALLDEAGHQRGEDGIRRLPNGERWEYDILCVSGWSTRCSKKASTKNSCGNWEPKYRTT